MIHEIKLHAMYGVDKSDAFFNKSKATSSAFFCSATGKDNSFYGEKHTEASKQLIRENVLNNHNHMCRQRGEANHNYGKVHTAETKALWSEQRKGSNNGKSKLTENDVMNIKSLLKLGKQTQTEIGNLFNVSKVAISHINTGYRWSHLIIEETA